MFKTTISYYTELKEIYLKCVLINGQLMPKQTYQGKKNFINLGNLINKPVLIDVKNLRDSLLKNRIFKLNVNKLKDNYISKEHLALSQIGLFKKKTDKDLKNLPIDEQKRRKELEKKETQIDKKNLPYKKEVYFEKILAKALTDYSYQWDAPVNNYLRQGEGYFSTDVFKQYYKRYGKTIDQAIQAIKNKVEDLDRAF